MQTGPAVRQTLTATVTAVWYVLVYGVTALALAADAWLTIPLLAWFAGYVGLLWYFVPRMRERSKVSSEARSALMGRIVDSYTNILTVKLFARPTVAKPECLKDSPLRSGRQKRSVWSAAPAPASPPS
jgi:ATP-binding cassette subfamily B multidrug efflux pump